MKKGLLIFFLGLFAQAVVAQDVDTSTGATQPVPAASEQSKAAASPSEDLTYSLVIVNKTASNYQVSLDGRTLGKVAPKKKQTFQVKPGGNGNLVAIQLDGYSIVPSKIMWSVPKQTPGNTVTFTIKKS